MKNNGPSIGEPRFTQMEMGQAICDAVGEMRDLLVRGFIREDAGLTADQGGSSRVHIAECSDDISNQIISRQVTHPFITIICDSPFAVRLIETELDNGGREVDGWKGYNNVAQLQVVPGQTIFLKSFGSGGGATASFCFYESIQPIWLNEQSSTPGPYVENTTVFAQDIGTTAFAVVAATPGYWTAVSAISIRPTATAAAPRFELQDGAGNTLWGEEVTKDETLRIVFPQGSEPLSKSTSGNALQLVSNISPDEATNWSINYKRVPRMA